MDDEELARRFDAVIGLLDAQTKRILDRISTLEWEVRALQSEAHALRGVMRNMMAKLPETLRKAVAPNS